MSRRRFKTNFEESLYQNSRSKTFYYDRLMELSISMFDWKNMPEEIDTVFLERTLFTSPYALFFKDDALGENGRYLALKMTYAGGFDVYRRPTKRRAYAVNGYNIERDETNSVIIYNNMIRTNACDMVRIYSDKLWEIDRAIDVNARAQKTPVLIKCTEQQRLTLQNVYKEFDGNAPVSSVILPVTSAVYAPVAVIEKNLYDGGSNITATASVGDEITFTKRA